MSDSDCDELRRTAMMVLTEKRADGKSTSPDPQRSPPSTPPGTPRKSQDSAPLSFLHAPTTPSDRDKAAQRLRDYRSALLEYICETPECLRPNGTLKGKWRHRVAAIAVYDESDLLYGFEVPPRANTYFKSAEYMEKKRELNRSPWGQSSLRYEVQQSADPRAYADRHRQVGGWYITGMEGDIEQAAVMDAQGVVDMELEGAL